MFIAAPSIQFDYTYEPYTSFLDYVLPHVIGVPAVTAERVIRDVVIDFCDESKIYTQTLDASFVPMGGLEFELELPPNTKLAGVNKLTLEDGAVLDPLRHFVVKQNVVELMQPMTMEGRVLAFVSLKPSRHSTSCPAFLYEDWVEVISYGAQAMLFNMVNEEWYNPRAAAAQYSLYRAGLAKAKRYAKTGRILGNTNSLTVDLT